MSRGGGRGAGEREGEGAGEGERKGEQKSKILNLSLKFYSKLTNSWVLVLVLKVLTPGY